MDIILQGKHSTEEMAESLLSVLQLFKQRYQISDFREIHLEMTLVDANGEDVELVDNQTDEVFRVFEVYRSGSELRSKQRRQPALRLVVDNKKKS